MTNASLRRAYRSLLWRLRLRRGLEAVVVAACIAAISALAGTPPGDNAIVAVVAWLLAYPALGMLPVYRRISPALFTQHLDRHFPELEESTRLMLADTGQLAPMRQLQRFRVEEALPASLADRRRWLPRAMRAATGWVLIAAGLLILLAAPIRSAVLSSATSTSISGSLPLGSGLESMIVSTELRIEPPAYTGIDARTTDHLDLELPEGSMVTWQMQFRRPGRYALAIGDEPLVLMTPGSGETYVATQRIDRTSLYRIFTVVNGSEQALAGVYTLSVSLDKPPRVRIIEPDDTTLEIERGETARFDSLVEVLDDFGLGPVGIRASVAKGSGEGVKFRDEVFDFDTHSANDANDSASRTYRRAWDLASLGMEPGDEVYFFVVAHDNRDPQPNVSRSDTVVVRWLDEAKEVLTGGDIAIDVMPEYYKSQRQIIIETEQLIADRDLLDADTFAGTSRELGEAQAELKNRYGQYLGDEFGESLEPQADTHDHDDDGDHDDEEVPGRELSDYIHTHEDADIGPVTARNPVGLMKRAIAKMWQAELHLRLAEPAESLPHQYEALDYYNRAREADRIFTQRLGFEPPPVTEERRLTGDIDDVPSSRLEEATAEARSDDRLFRELYDRLSRRSPTEPFNQDELDLLAQATVRLQELSADRPAFIKQAAVLERLRVAGGPANNTCEDCAVDAIRTAWSMLSSAQAQPVQGARPVDVDDALIREYAGLGPALE
ncbi:MAG: hypothetical protein KC572_13950 [Gammaproteobacteria bacterium]|nr:hypothetical protein [Gammaproteobacteria bacterium]